MDTSEPLIYSRKDAARMISVSLRALDYLIANKQLTVIRLGRRIGVPRRSLEAFSKRDHVQLSGRSPNTGA